MIFSSASEKPPVLVHWYLVKAVVSSLYVKLRIKLSNSVLFYIHIWNSGLNSIKSNILFGKNCPIKVFHSYLFVVFH